MNKNTGAGVSCPDDSYKNSCSLGSYFTLFQIEAFAILMCCSVCLDIGSRNRCVHICFDSQAELLDLSKHGIICHTVRE